MEPILQMKGISKKFGNVKVLDNVDLTLYRGRVLALLGENGAGKSTLMKILCGIYEKDEGGIYLKGKKVNIRNVRDAEKYGIAMIHQELNLVPSLSIAENIFLGREYVRTFNSIDWKKIKQESAKILHELGMDLNVDRLVKHLSVGEQQMVEIARSLLMNAEILVMDEPTAALTEGETRRLFEVIKRLRKEGKSIIYISHRMNEIFEICDDYIVLRDGRLISQGEISEVTRDDLVKMMVGRELKEHFPYESSSPGEEILRVENLTVKGMFEKVSFVVRRGEVVGLAGLIGAGRTEVAKTIFGFYRKTSGKIYLGGEEVKINSPRDAIEKGIMYLSEDRRNEGLIIKHTLKENMTLSALKKISDYIGTINFSKERSIVNEMIQKLNIKSFSPNQKIFRLSGGNQQKVAIAKCLLTNPKLIILDEPTRGIDVGAKNEIYKLINDLKRQGIGIILISSELPEVLNISDRIIVMHEGKITGEISREEATEEKVMLKAVGGE
ncbi:sugar ABC transporter ATP-binding protein [Caldanaerobacter subterraneus]|uniref:Sugar ABC transporter ATP-binding protein n=1 Tax=Caldanaerobacter subterraneus TaxID=911092 RepID=A0A7Y2L6T6_9THEO|nr:sugar ABC transporter ATP-binding protein [Caldanaerobacter subterraneus]MBE3578673.1 sugar ABC transporter ATP-binding protein [Caldanaerobacter subterraneus]NNG66839.1 sugar ABC transporter ATP-binding protein [Caldanaerobacter subterraneus]